MSSGTATCWSTRATPGRRTTSTRGPVRCAGSWAAGTRASGWAPARRPAWQHDAIQQPDGAITFFDNGATPVVHPQSRGIELALDTANMTATLVRSYEHQNSLVAGGQGNVQALAGGDWIVGWGQAGYLSEVNPAGQVLFNAHLPPDWESYRTFAYPWSGQPAEPPALAIAAEPAGTVGAARAAGTTTPLVPRTARPSARWPPTASPPPPRGGSSTRAGTARPKSPPGGCSRDPRRARWWRSRARRRPASRRRSRPPRR